MSFVTINGLDKTYSLGGKPFFALRDVSLSINAGELIFIVGKSGSGKSTLMNMVAGLDRPDRGKIHVGDTAVHSLDEDALARFRGKNVGVVFQFFQLLPTLTVLENVLLAMDFAGKIPASKRRARALDLLEQVRVAEHASKMPTALSGGQQQRVAIARALANDPPLIVADEPTGNLDSHTASVVMNLFSTLAQAGRTLLLVTHETEVGIHPTRIIRLVDGQVARDDREGRENTVERVASVRSDRKDVAAQCVS